MTVLYQFQRQFRLSVLGHLRILARLGPDRGSFRISNFGYRIF